MLLLPKPNGDQQNTFILNAGRFIQAADAAPARYGCALGRPQSQARNLKNQLRWPCQQRLNFASEGTVKNHISHILTRLDLRDRTQAALYARDHHLI